MKQYTVDTFTDTHAMKLAPQPFDLIACRQKTIELRLYDEKRQRIKQGDRIVFTNTNDESKAITAKVERLYVFRNFEELYKELPLEKCGYSAESAQNADYTDMEKYYSKAEQSKYGVVGIEISVVE